MSDYIERSVVERLLTIAAAGDGKRKHRTWARAICVLHDAPNADAAEVRRGTWDILDGYKTRRVCSACGWDVPEYGKFYSYCPNCGAKMDKTEDRA